MIIKKITHGFVVQVFDTNTSKFVSQEFVAGDDCAYEDKAGNPVELSLFEVYDPLKDQLVEAYFPYNMIQPI